MARAHNAKQSSARPRRISTWDGIQDEAVLSKSGLREIQNRPRPPVVSAAAHGGNSSFEQQPRVGDPRLKQGLGSLTAEPCLGIYRARRARGNAIRITGNVSSRRARIKTDLQGESAYQLRIVVKKCSVFFEGSCQEEYRSPAPSLPEGEGQDVGEFFCNVKGRHNRKTTCAEVCDIRRSCESGVG